MKKCTARSCFVLMLWLLIFIAGVSSNAAERAQSVNSIESVIGRILVPDNQRHISADNFETDALEALKRLGSCGDILQVLFERANREGKSTQVICGGSYVTFIWYENELDEVVTVKVMVGFDRLWHPTDLKVAVQRTPPPPLAPVEKANKGSLEPPSPSSAR